MNVNLTNMQAIRLHSLLETLPLLISSMVSPTAKQELLNNAAQDEMLKDVAAKLHTELITLKVLQDQTLSEGESILTEADKVDLEATLKKLVSEQEICGYERGWVLYQLEDEIDFTTLTQQQWKTIAVELDFQSGWAWHQHQKHFKPA